MWNAGIVRWSCAAALLGIAACNSDEPPAMDKRGVAELAGTSGTATVGARAGSTAFGSAGTPAAQPAAPAAVGGSPASPPAANRPPANMPPANMPPAGMPPANQPWNTNGKTCLQAGSGKFGEPGPYKVGQMAVDLGMVQAMQTTGKFTIFYPMPLETSCPHPIVAWGNGTGVNDATTYAFFNSNAASWGMVVIASQDPNTGSGAFHKAGLDYLLKQNEDPMSMFYKKLSPRAGTSGHSQGAFGSVAGAQHPNVSVNVGVGGSATSAAKYASMCLTGTEDIAATSCPALADRAQGPFFAASWNGGDHVTTETVAGYIGRNAGTMAMQRLYAAWFRCYLADDGVACNLFKGATPEECGLCKEKQDWAVLKSRNIQ